MEELRLFGGEMLLHEMKRRHIMSKAIVVTQFDLFGKDEDEITLIDLDLRLMKQFPINYLELYNIILSIHLGKVPCWIQ